MLRGDKHVQAAVAHRLDWAEGTLSAAASWVRFLRPGFFPLSPALPLPIRGPGIVGPTQRSEEGGLGGGAAAGHAGTYAQRWHHNLTLAP